MNTPGFSTQLPQKSHPIKHYFMFILSPKKQNFIAFYLSLYDSIVKTLECWVASGMAALREISSASNFYAGFASFSDHAVCPPFFLSLYFYLSLPFHVDQLLTTEWD